MRLSRFALGATVVTMLGCGSRSDRIRHPRRARLRRGDRVDPDRAGAIEKPARDTSANPSFGHRPRTGEHHG